MHWASAEPSCRPDSLPDLRLRRGRHAQLRRVHRHDEGQGQQGAQATHQATAGTIINDAELYKVQNKKFNWTSQWTQLERE